MGMPSCRVHLAARGRGCDGGEGGGGGGGVWEGAGGAVVRRVSDLSYRKTDL